MALVVKDRVKVTTTTTGTGTITLGAAASGFQSFAVIGNANQTYYTIVGGSEWEVGIGTYTSSGTTLSRDTVLDSSNAGNKVNFSAGSKDVFVVYPAGRSVMTDFEQTISNKTVITTTQTALQYATSNLPSIKPTLLLDFANVKALDPRITFTRASEGRYYDGKTFAKAEENLLLQSQTLATAPWSSLRSTRTNNAGTAPDGTNTATQLTQQSGQTIFGNINQAASVSVNATTSVFAKADGKNFLVVQTQSAGSLRTWFNLSTGSVGTTNANHTASIVSVGNGWYRCIITSSQTGDITSFYLADTDGSSTVTDSGSILLWGTQLEQRSSVTAYTATTTQPITNYIPVLMTAANGVARFDHNPVTGESLGLLIEEQRTNLLTYSEQFDNAAWTKARSSITANTIVAPDGTLTGDKLVEDTSASNTHLMLQSVSSTASNTHTFSFYAKAAERSEISVQLDNTVVSGASGLFNLLTGATTVITGTTTLTTTAVGNGWWRCSISGVPAASGSTVRVVIYLSVAGNAAYTGNGYSGAFIWGAQLEAGSGPATSYIPTVAAQVTRSADAASMTGANFSSWYRADEGSIYVEGGIPANYASGFQSLFSINDNTTNNRIVPGINASADVLNVETITGGSVVASYYPAYTSGMTKVVMAYKVNDMNYAKDGVAGTTDTSATVPTVSQLNIGSASSGNALNGHIRKIAFYPARVTNAQLQALTS